MLDVNFFDESAHRSCYRRRYPYLVYGEVKKPETINYRTLKPEKGRLVLREDLRTYSRLGVLLR